MSLQQDIDRGLEITAEIGRLKEELKSIASRVEKWALNGPQIPLEDKDRDGTQYLAKGSAQIVPVVITADYLAGSFGHLSPKHQEIVKTIPHREPILTDFYAMVIDDGKEFRQLARDVLAEDAVKFIVACLARDKDGIPKNAVKIAWDRARELAQ